MSAPALWPERVRMLRGPAGIRMLVDRRALAVAAILAGLTVALGAWALTLGDVDIPLAEVVAALAGDGETSVRRIVVEWRLPRILLAVVGGASLALSGAIFQSMTRNPLGSPDIIGFGTGAYTGALVVTLILGASSLLVPVGAFAGGLATAVLVYALAFRGGLHGFRLIVVGIAVSAMLAAVNAYLLARARLEEAMSMAIWGSGTLNGARWGQVMPVVIVLLVAVPALVLLSRRLLILELGDEHARMLGVDVERTRILLLVVGVALVATVTAVAGPISFVALAAPQIARRLVRATGPSLLASALLGGLLMLASDLVAQRVAAPTQYPVGVVTACLGGGYLIWLLLRGRRETA